MKKLFVSISFMLCALILVSASAFAAQTGSATSAKAKDYTVISNGVNVRSGPGATYSKLGALSKGTKETGTVKDGWLEFTYNGKSAYCLAKCFKSDTDEKTASTDKSTSKTGTYVVSATELTVRSGPGATYSSLGQLKKGTKETGTVIDGWLKFTFDSKTAYCNMKFMSAAAASK